MHVRDRLEQRIGLPPDTAVDPTSRHPGDVVRLVVGAVVVVVSVLLVRRDSLTLFEVNLFQLVNDLPSSLGPVLWPVMQLGGFAAVPVLSLLAFVAARRHRRAAVDLAVAGTLGYVLARVLKDLIERPRPGGFLESIERLASAEGLGFVSGHATVAAALVGAVAPYLPRRARRAVWVLPWLVGLGRLFYGVHLPMDVVGGAALGWAVAAGVHLALGAPHRVPTLDDAAAVLARAGLAPTALRRVPGVARGSFPFEATIGGERVFVKLLDPEPRDRDVLYRLARLLAVRDVRDEAAIAGPAARAYREVAMSLLARDAGARVPRVLRVEEARGRAWVLQQHVEGATLDALGADVDDATLLQLWGEALLLRDAGVAHRDLVASNVLVDRDGNPWLVDLAHAETSTRRRALDNDLAELLAASALAVGVDRTVATARRVVPAALLAAAAPELQPFVLTAETREGLRAAPGLLDELRAAVAAAAGADRPRTVPSRAPTPRAALLLAACASSLAILVGVAGPRAVGAVLADVSWRWLVTALLLAVVGWLAGTVLLVAAVDRRLAIGRTLLARLGQHATTTLRRPCGDREQLLAHLGAAAVPSAEAVGGLTRAAGARRRALLGGAVAVGGLLALARPSVAPTAAAGWLGLLAAVLVLAAVDSCRALPRAAADAGTSSVVRGVTRWTRELSAGVELAACLAATAALVHALGGGVALAAVAALHVAVAGLDVAAGPATRTAGTVLLAVGLVLFGLPLANATAAALLVAAVQRWLPAGVGLALPSRATGGA